MTTPALNAYWTQRDELVITKSLEMMAESGHEEYCNEARDLLDALGNDTWVCLTTERPNAA